VEQGDVMRTLRERPSVGNRTRFVAATAMAIAALLFASSVPARAQVPALPEVPPEVEDALHTIQDTVVPILIQAANEGRPVANGIGWALRPGCSSTGSVFLVVAVAGGTLPVSPGFAATPLFILCAAAHSPGQADPFFKELDRQYGKTIFDTVNPILKQAAAQLAPVRPELSDVCGVLALIGSAPRQVPPPLHRFDFVSLICKG